MLDQVVEILKKKQEQGKVKFWRAYDTFEKRREFYVLGEGPGRAPVLDQVRMVEQKTYLIEVWVSKGELQGFASKVIQSHLDLISQIEECLNQAQVSSEKLWEPPQPSSEFVFHPEQCFSGLDEDFLGASEVVYKKLHQDIVDTSKGVFNSAELFCVITNSELRASNGFLRKQKKTRLYAEVCFSERKGEESQEYLVTEWCVHPDQLDTRKMCDESAEFAGALLGARNTPQSEYSVLLSADVLNEVFHDLKSHLDARSKYYQRPFIPQGEKLIPGYEGADFGLEINPGRDWAMASRTDDGWGRSQPLLMLATNNEVMSSICSYQMSQYLDMAPSTVGGCLEVDVKGESVEDLLADQDVLEILQFSGLFTSSIDLTFSSEIRLARLWKKDGSVQFLKGGSLSGSVKDHFKTLRFSNEKVCHNKFEDHGTISYFGPEKALISGVPVTA